MGDQTHWLFSPDSVMNSDPHLNPVKKEEDEDTFLDDLDLQDEDMSFSDLSFNMNMNDYSDLTEERLLGMSEEELTGMFTNQDIPQLVQPQPQQTLQLQVQQQQQAQQLLQAQQQQQMLQQQQQQTLQQVPDLQIVQQEQPQQVIVAPKTEAVNTGSVNVSSDLTNLVALLLNNQQQPQPQTTVNNVATPTAAPAATHQLVSTPVASAAATTVRPATASEVIQQLVQKEQQKQMQNKTIAQLALILQLQQQQQQQQQQQVQQQTQQPLLMSTLQTTTTQPQITTQLQQPQKVTTLPQQQQTPVQQKVIPLSVQKTALPNVQVIKQETTKPAVTTVPQLVIQSSQNGNVAIVGSTMATVSSPMVRSPEATTTTSSMSKIAIPPLSSSPNGGGMLGGKKPEKRKSHNAIEQRYRKSINGRIEDLKTMLFKENKKVSKSHTLQKAIDHLIGLRKMCQTLKQENLSLKAELEKYKGTTTVPDVKDPLTPPSSFTGSPDHCYVSGSEPESPYSGPDSCPDSPLDMNIPPSPVRTNAGPAGGLLDRTRLVLCVFMFSILAFNPFGFLINKGFESFVVGSSAGYGGDSGSMSAGGRKLMGEEDGGDVGMMSTALSLIWHVVPTLLIWLMNGTIIATVLVTMLYGDKTAKSSSINVTAYWRYRTQAEQEIMKGNIAQALNQLFHCFAALGRNHPLGNLEYYASFIWNLFCLPLNLVFKGRGIGAWLSRPKGDKQKDGKYPVAQSTARDIAKTYHHIVQLFLTANFSLGVPRAFYMGVCSINHAERARDAMSPTERAEIYATVGVLIRTRFSKSLQWLASLVFYRVRFILNRSKSPTPPILSWTLAAFSQHFKQNDVIPTSWQGPSYFTTITEKRNPLVVVSQHLREQMIHNILKGILTLTPEDSQDSQKNKRSVDQDFMMRLNRLSISLDEASNYYQQNVDVSSNLQARNEYDPVARWWVNLLFVAAYWQIGDEEKAETYISCIDSLPAELQKESFPLAALQACKARLALLSAAQNDIPDDCLRISDLASNNLVRSMDACYSGDNSVMLVQLLVVDWLLSTRSAVWQQRQQGSPSTIPATKNELSAFQQDLTTLRKLASELPNVGSKVTLYEAVGRLMAGANPVRTQVLLDRNLRKRNTDPKQKDSEVDSSTTEHDRAQSLLVKSCYLYSTMPSDQVERKNLLNDAVRSLEKVGDHRGMQSCQQMLQSLQKSGSTQSTNTTVTTACC